MKKVIGVWFLVLSLLGSTNSTYLRQDKPGEYYVYFLKESHYDQSKIDEFSNFGVKFRKSIICNFERTRRNGLRLD